MIKITETPNAISVSGHAGYAEHGKDIVCSAVSTLLQTFILSLEELTSDHIISDIRQGNAVIRYKDLSEQGKFLKESFFIGMQGVASAYPEHVKVCREARPSVEDDKSNR